MFNSPVFVMWVEDHPRNMMVTGELVYTDPLLKEWTVPAGTIINGLSVPRLLWPILGSPYISMARRASVFHDHYYQTREYTKQETDLMFYEAMLEDGVYYVKAKAMYVALQSAGETWEDYDNRDIEDDDDD